MTAERLEFVSRFEDGSYKHYLAYRWPSEIMVAEALLACGNTFTTVEGDSVTFQMANGAATYDKIKGDDIYWQGRLRPGSTFVPVS